MDGDLMSKLRLTARGEVATGVIVLLALILAGWVLLVMVASPAANATGLPAPAATVCVNPPTGNVYCHPSATISYPRPTLSHSTARPAVSPRTSVGAPLTVHKAVVRPATKPTTAQPVWQQPQLANTGAPVRYPVLFALLLIAMGVASVWFAGWPCGGIQHLLPSGVVAIEEIQDELPMAVAEEQSA